mmetsp:Transcript_23644/g.35468  ORF Transcript_23644/g.35468 Transcript_23644/m.35468 type:complete len:111 (-) Transcript_23644:65-397(-)
MLSSLSDRDPFEDAFTSLASLPSKAGDNAMKQIREVAEERMKSTGKEVDIEYRVATPAGDVKTAILVECKAEKADFLIMGPGLNGHGSVPPFAVQHAKGMTLCIIRDHLE